MASPLLRPKLEDLIGDGSHGPAALRLLAAERPEEILPVLLEEIGNLGFPRALILTLDFETGEIKPAASLHSERAFLRKFHTFLWATENPLVAALIRGKAVLLPANSIKEHPLYLVPMAYRSRTRCWEAEREWQLECLAAQNFYGRRKLQVQEQTCAICNMRSYVMLVVAQTPKRRSEKQLRALRAIVDRANRHLSRLFKVEHYYNRMRDMEVTISRMGTVMQSMADPVILTDNQHRVIIQNKAAERFFRVPEGVSEGGRRAVELNNLLFSAALSSMVVSGTDASRDLTLVDVMEGEEVLFEAVCGPTTTGDGTRTGMVTVMRDVTDLRRADQEVRANLEKLRMAEEVVRQDRDRLNLVIENVGDPIIVADNSAKIVLFDPLAKELFASSGSSRDPELVKNQAKLDAYLTSFTFSFVEKENKSLRLFQPGTRSEIEYAARSGKIYDGRGQVAYTVTVLRDFSTWRKLEQLQMERRMLEMEKFAATGRLAGTIAHEINNPMEAIKNAIYLLKGKLDSSAEPVYEVLKNETDRVTRIVRQMLGLYRNTHQLGTFDLNAVVEDTLALFGRPLIKTHINVRKELGKLPGMRGSADQFRQLLSNLVVNAQDAMPQGGDLIIRTRHLRASDGIHGWITITVVDTGSGIPKDLRASIFEPFVSTKGEKGTGLGLWIVKGIVENHAGRILVRSTPGKGTMFKLAFPISHELPVPRLPDSQLERPVVAGGTS
ncbi:MAG: PAS domain-containing protein [Acidobacteria bacterium]|nr:PAS domain-containing protein [Acidobacteriota bacterium]